MRADRPSSTALLIARCTLLAERDPALRALVPAAAVGPLHEMLAVASGDRWFDFALRHASIRATLRALERTVLPGIIAHYLARKRWLEQRVLATRHGGCEQIVVLGAGLDTLAWRLHRAHPAVQFFELDHPATQQVKVAALVPGENLTLLPTDLFRVLPTTALQAHARFAPHRRTCFVAEGLLMYFPESRVKELFLDLAQVPGREIAFTCMAPGPDGRAEFRDGSSAIGAWLRWRREPFAWAIAPEAIDRFLHPLGWRVLALAGASKLREEILAPLGLSGLALAEGEFLCFATTAP